MKISQIILLLLSSLNFLGQEVQKPTTEIQIALDSNIIEVEIEGYYGKTDFHSIDHTGFYFGKCITMTFYNKTDSIMNVYMPVGTILRCRDTSVQDMIVTKSFALDLYPKYKEGYLIYAMCGEISDKGPVQGVFYDLGGLAEPEVVSIAQLIEEKKIQNNIGQLTMWAVRNNADSTKLIEYGASYKDLQTVVNYINEIQWSSKLSSQIKPTEFSLKKSKPLLTNTTAKNDDYTVNTLTWLLICFCGVLILTIVLITIKKNNKIA